VDRTHAGIARARDGFRTPDRRSPDGGAARRAGPAHGPRARRLGTLGALAAVAVAVVGATSAPHAAGAATPGTTGPDATLSATASDAPLTLRGQSAFVGPGGALSLHLAVDRGVSPDATVTVTVFPHLTSRSALVAAIGGTLAGTPLGTSPPFALSSLPPDPGGGVDITVPVAAGGPAPTVPGSQFTADLHCSVGACGGVYPVRIALSAPGVGPGKAQLVTNLVYEDPPATTQRLRVAWVVPVSLPAQAASTDGRVAPTASSALSATDAFVTALAGHPEVALTVAPEPASVAALAGDTLGRAKHALGQIQAIAATPGREALAGPYASADASALMGAGLPTELADQVARGAQSLASDGVRATAGTWAASSALDEETLAQLGTLGISHALVPPGTVAGNPFRLSPTQPLTIQTGKQATMALAVADPILSTHFADATGAGSVLAANQFLADLALVYYEQPNLDTARGIVALAPLGWTPDPSFVDTVLAGLAANPVLEPVTVTTLFATVPTGPTVGARRPAPDAGTTLPARAIRVTRGRIDAFATAVSDPAVPRGVGDLLLDAESALLRPVRQAAGVTGASATLDAELGQVSITADSIRLTSTTAHVPITIVKTAPYTVTAVMTLSSDKLLFPRGSTRTVVLDRATNAFYVDMQARTAGVFKVTVTLLSPRGGLVVAARQLTVRSASTSEVAIALSIGALLVLLGWWGQTLWRRRDTPRGAHARRRRPHAAEAAGTGPAATGRPTTTGPAAPVVEVLTPGPEPGSGSEPPS